MRHGGATGRRLRNRGGSGGGGSNGGNAGNNNSGRRSHGGGGNNRNQVFDSNGPDVRIRGTAFQIQEKYATLAKDSASMGDHVLAESYLQHAEHYQRIIIGWGDQIPGHGQQPQAAQYEEEEAEDGRSYQDRRFDVRPRQQQQTQQPQQNTQASDTTDLGLPASIIGEVVREPELT